MDQNWGQRPHLPLKTMFLVSSSSDNNIIIIIISGLDGLSLIDQNDGEQIQYPSDAASARQPDKGSHVEGIPNQLLPALLRPRWWWHSYYSRRNEEERQPGESTASLCEAVVIWRHCLAAHRTLLHSLCDVPHDSSPPPPGGGSSRGVGLSPIAAPSRARDRQHAAPHGDRTRGRHRHDGGAAEGADVDRCAAGSPPHLELEAANATPRCSATGGATKTSLDIWWT